jgi:hypothetical protein
MKEILWTARTIPCKAPSSGAFAAVQIDDAFLAPKLELLRTVTLGDVFTKFEKDGAFANFDRVAQD